jgi:hypothetical protein
MHCVCSHKKAAAATKEGRFKREIVPLTGFDVCVCRSDLLNLSLFILSVLYLCNHRKLATKCSMTSTKV